MAERSGEGTGDRGCSPLLVSTCLLGVRCNHEGEALRAAGIPVADEADIAAGRTPTDR